MSASTTVATASAYSAGEQERYDEEEYREALAAKYMQSESNNDELQFQCAKCVVTFAIYFVMY